MFPAGNSHHHTLLVGDQFIYPFIEQSKAESEASTRASSGDFTLDKHYRDLTHLPGGENELLQVSEMSFSPERMAHLTSTSTSPSLTGTSYHPYRRRSSSVAEKTGRWTAEEHDLFLQGLEKYGKVWKEIATMIPTRTVVQIRTHAQKYLMKLEKANGGTASTSSRMPSSSSVTTKSTKQLPQRRRGNSLQLPPTNFIKTDTTLAQERAEPRRKERSSTISAYPLPSEVELNLGLPPPALGPASFDQTGGFHHAPVYMDPLGCRYSESPSGVDEFGLKTLLQTHETPHLTSDQLMALDYDPYSSPAHTPYNFPMEDKHLLMDCFNGFK